MITKDERVTQSQEQQFGEVVNIIVQHKSQASRAVNQEMLLTAWHVGGYVSAKLKSEEWGSKVVKQLSEYIRSQRPDIRGFSRQSIYNMVMFYDAYTSEAFIQTVTKYLNVGFVQPVDRQIVQPMTAQLQEGGKTTESKELAMVQTLSAQIVQSVTGQLPKIVEMTTFTNHVEILNRCHSPEERMFYILYAHKEHLASRELRRCIDTQTFATLLGSKKSMSKGVIDIYPNAMTMFKDKLFVDFLNLPRYHSESKLRKGLVEHMKQFILELGKDFLFVDEEYQLTVGASTFKATYFSFTVDCKPWWP